MTTARAVSWSEERRDSGVSSSPSRASGSPNIPCNDSRSMPPPSTPPGSPRAPRRPVRSCWAAAEDSARAASSSSIRPRTAGRVSTELEASSRAHTQSSASSSGRLQSAANVAMLAVTRRSSSDGAHGTAKRVLAEGPLGEVAHHRADLQPEEHRSDGGGPLAEQARRGRPSGSSPPNGSAVERRPVGRRRAGRAGCRGHGRQERPPRVEGPEGPVTPAHRHAGQPAAVGRDGHAGGLGHVELRHPGQLLERILWTGSTLASGVPPVATLRAKERVISHWLRRVGPEHVHQVAEQGLERVARVPGFGRCHAAHATARSRLRCIGVGLAPVPPRSVTGGAAAVRR